MTIEKILKQAHTALIENRLDEAEKDYKKVIELEPNHVIAHNNLGVTHQRLGRLNEAIISYKKAIEFKSDFVDAYYNLGAIYKSINELKNAEASYKKAIELKPNNEDALYNLSNVLSLLDKIDEAEESFKKIIRLNPKLAKVHNNLGNILLRLDKIDEAEESFKKSIEINPGLIGALINIGKILFKKGKFELSLKNFDACSKNKSLANKFYGEKAARQIMQDSRSHALISLYALGQIDEIYKRIEMNSELDKENLSVAAFSSFISHKEKKETMHKFCNKPIDFIKISNLSSHLKNSDLFINELIEELHDNVKTRWEPNGKSTLKGFQSIGNLFKNNLVKLCSLKLIILDELKLYQSKFKDEMCTFIQKWPTKKDLFAWHVILKKQGYQTPHIHQSGWLSGVIYLKVVPSLEKNEGAIEFSLNSESFNDENSPKLIHQPKAGDIVLFPSSLHHRTIPFTTDMDRIIVSFDLGPDKKIILSK